MRALIFDEKLRFENDIPVKHNENEALIKVSMAGICNTDLEITKGYMGFKGIIGHEFVGIVKEAEDDSLIGKRVCGEINAYCNDCDFCHKGLTNHCPNRTVLGIFNRDGAFSDYVSLPEELLHIVPDNVIDEEAVFVEPIAAAFNIVEQVAINTDTTVAVLGDGKLGLLIAQVLSIYSNNVTVIGKHHDKLALLKNCSTLLLDQAGKMKVDVVVEATGNPAGLELALEIIRPKGTLVLKTTVAETVKLNSAKIVVDEIKIIGSRCGPFKPALEALRVRKVNVRPMISAIYSFNEALMAMEFATKPGVIKVLMKM